MKFIAAGYVFQNILRDFGGVWDPECNQVIFEFREIVKGEQQGYVNS